MGSGGAVGGSSSHNKVWELEAPQPAKEEHPNLTFQDPVKLLGFPSKFLGKRLYGRCSLLAVIK